MTNTTKKITVYSTPTCPYCVYAKDFLNKKGVQFEDVDVSRDHARAIEMMTKSGQMGVPVIDVDGQILVGFEPAALDQLLAG